MTISKELQDVFRSVFEQPELSVTPEMTADDVDGWDSITHLDLIVSVEKAFNIKISGFEVMQLNNVGSLQNLVNKKTSA